MIGGICAFLLSVLLDAHTTKVSPSNYKGLLGFLTHLLMTSGALRGKYERDKEREPESAPMVT